MHWLRESSDLKVDLFPKKKSSVKSYLQSFLRISGTDLSSHPSSNSQYLQSNEESPEILPESQGNSNPVSKKNFDYDKIFRRLSSMNSDKDTSFRTQSNDQPSQNEDISPPNRSSLLSPIFISSALFQLSNSKSSHIPQEQSFYNGTIQLFRSGTLIVNYERLINTELPDNDESGIQSYSQKLSRSYSCQKILCLKYDPHKDQDISQIGLILRIFSTKLEEDNLVRRPTPLIKPMTKETTNLKNNDYEDIILYVLSLRSELTFM